MTSPSHKDPFSFRDVTSPSHVCSECKQLLPIGSKALTCGPKCRKRRERRQKDAHSAHIMVLHELAKIRESLKRQEDVKVYRERLIRLKDEINDLLLLANDDDAKARFSMLNDRARRF